MAAAAFRFQDEDHLDAFAVPKASMHVDIDVYSENNFWSGITMDLSEGGVFIATHKDMQVGDLLIVDMDIPGEAEPLIALAEVRWSRIFSDNRECPPGHGLAFVHISDDALGKIRRFVERFRDPLLFEV